MVSSKLSTPLLVIRQVIRLLLNRHNKQQLPFHQLHKGKIVAVVQMTSLLIMGLMGVKVCKPLSIPGAV